MYYNVFYKFSLVIIYTQFRHPWRIKIDILPGANAIVFALTFRDILI